MRGGEGKVVGGLLVVLAGLALFEAYRLHALRTEMVAGAVVGDDTFPLIVGVAMLVLGAHILLLARLPRVTVAPPSAAARRQMLWGAGILAAYWAVLPLLGYTASTALASVGLYRAMSSYRWPLVLLIAGVTTAVLFLVFRVWLHEPLPSGLLGF
jgi:putative tricarboxylic transport membrane protein